MEQRWEKVKRVAEDREPGKDREAARVHTPDPPDLSERLEQERRKTGRETPKHENCEQRNFPRQNPPELSGEQGRAETESDLLSQRTEMRISRVRMSVPMTGKAHSRARSVEGVHRTTCPYSFVPGETKACDTGETSGRWTEDA